MTACGCHHRAERVLFACESEIWLPLRRCCRGLTPSEGSTTACSSGAAKTTKWKGSLALAPNVTVSAILSYGPTTSNGDEGVSREGRFYDCDVDIPQADEAEDAVPRGVGCLRANRALAGEAEDGAPVDGGWLPRS